MGCPNKERINFSLKTRSRTRDLQRQRTSLYQDCGRGHNAACFQFDDIILVRSASIEEVSQIWLVQGSKKVNE